MGLDGSTRRRALVIGGGIGGSAAALWLKRAGLEPVVFEAQAESDTAAGSFLNIASNGLRVLQQLGLDGAVAAEGFRIPHMVMWSGSGRQLGVVRNGLPPGQGPVSMVVRRSALHRILREAAMREGIAFHDEKRLSAIR